MLLSQLAARVDGVARADERAVDPEITSIVNDSREVDQGALFVALDGANVDGHDFVGDALEAGARAVCVERERRESLGVDAPVLVAEDTRRELGPLAAEFYGHPADDLVIVGITGTNGKTTTTHLVASILREAGGEVGLIGTVGVRWAGRAVSVPNTTPESLRIQQLLEAMRSDGVESVVMEISSHGLATHRMRGTAVDCGVLTNLTQDHLDFHGDMASYRAAKGALFRDLLPAAASRGKSPRAILNVDDAFGRALADELADEPAVEVATYSRETSAADTFLETTGERLSGTEIAIRLGDRRRRIETPLLGRFNVENCAAAAAVGRATGCDLVAIARGLADPEAVPGRLERVTVDGSGAGGPAVFVDYAHTPNALERVLETLRPLTPGRLIVVFGCGGDRDRDKRPRMGAVAERVADVCVITSDNPRSEVPEAIVDDILDGMSAPVGWDLDEFDDRPRGIRVEVERGRAIEEAIARAGREDAVVIAGKGHEAYQEIDGEKRPFDDATRARAALETR